MKLINKFIPMLLTACILGTFTLTPVQAGLKEKVKMVVRGKKNPPMPPPPPSPRVIVKKIKEMLSFPPVNTNLFTNVVLTNVVYINTATNMLIPKAK